MCNCNICRCNYFLCYDVLSVFFLLFFFSFCVEVLWSSQPNGVMSSMVSLPDQTFTGQA